MCFTHVCKAPDFCFDMVLPRTYHNNLTNILTTHKTNLKELLLSGNIFIVICFNKLTSNSQPPLSDTLFFDSLRYRYDIWLFFSIRYNIDMIFRPQKKTFLLKNFWRIFRILGESSDFSEFSAIFWKFWQIFGIFGVFSEFLAYFLNFRRIFRIFRFAAKKDKINHWF